MVKGQRKRSTRVSVRNCVLHIRFNSITTLCGRRTSDVNCAVSDESVDALCCVCVRKRESTSRHDIVSGKAKVRDVMVGIKSDYVRSCKGKR